ncbi:MAG: endonuclease/exonuclease/phosphatase family protein [Armatimonadetes bacterium]|nr:endonuclease/exonuclease/phosphatase family protein [Armatimonadota bacterium]
MKKRKPLLRWACALLLVTYYSAFFIATFADDRNWIVCLAATGTTGTLIPLALIGAILLAIRRHWIELGSFVALTFFYFIVSGQLFLRTAPVLADKQELLKVMSFNVEHGWHGVEKIAQIVRDEGVDAFALQECGLGSDADAIAELKKLLPDYTFLSDSSRTSATRLPLLSQRTVSLTPFEMSWSILEQDVLFHGTTVRILNVHSPSYLPDATLRRPFPQWFARWGEVATEQHHLLDTELQVISHDKSPTVLCGDFNMTPVGGRYQKLARVAKDTFATVGQGLGYTSPSRFPTRRIDFIWSFPGVRPIECHTVDRDASDHAAVVAALSVGGQ